MTTLAEFNREPFSWRRFLAREFAPREGRGAAVARISVAVAITVAIAMVFRIPQPAYMAYMVFNISKDDQAATVQTAIGGLLAMTMAVVACLLLFTVDVAEPAIRLPAMALTAFIGMYTSRIFALGPISFLAGFVMVLVQALVDDIPNTEALTRITLWLWVVVAVPVVVSVLTNLLVGQSSLLLLKRTVVRALAQVESSLLASGPRPTFADLRADVAGVLALSEKPVRRSRDGDAVSEPVVRRLLEALSMLDVLAPDLPLTARQTLARRVRASRLRIQDGSTAAAETLPTDGAMASPALLALDDIFGQLYRSIGQPPPAPSHSANSKRGLFVADAFTNPEYLRFAFKSTVAVMVAYSIYTLLDYPGARTALVTCFFVSLGTLGETVHKLVLRITGAVIGGIAAALCIVFLLPSLTDIGQLCVLVAAVAALCGWIATSSERISYAGMQMAFAFYLGVLHGYAPATDLTILRDRVAGILLGNIVVTITFSLMWPESAEKRFRVALADLLHAIGSLLRAQGSAKSDARLGAATALVRLDKYSVMQQFELRMLPSRGVPPSPYSVQSLDRLAGAALVATSDALMPYARLDLMEARARWADEAASSVLASSRLPPAPESIPDDARLGQGAEPTTESVSGHADRNLQREIENVLGAHG